ncbi:hypothetical protein C8J57DRAFT_1727313 [Mycena rebaudengoi]|nr:hypothetical protein C8J57DRAFT_1727313 [Mycena rebaudengoi]
MSKRKWRPLPSIPSLPGANKGAQDGAELAGGGGERGRGVGERCVYVLHMLLFFLVGGSGGHGTSFRRARGKSLGLSMHAEHVSTCVVVVDLRLLATLVVG